MLLSVCEKNVFCCVFFCQKQLEKNLPANAGDIKNTGLIPGLRRSPGRGHDNPLQDPYLENPVDKGAW